MYLYFDLGILILGVCRRAIPRSLGNGICVDGSLPGTPNHKPQLILRKCQFQGTLRTPLEWSEILDCQLGMSLNNIVTCIKTSYREWRLYTSSCFRLRLRNYNNSSLCCFPQSKINWNGLCDFLYTQRKRFSIKRKQ